MSRMWKHLCKNLFRDMPLKYFFIQQNLQRVCTTKYKKPRNKIVPIILGLVPFFGTMKKEKPDDPLITTMKRAILAQNKGNLPLAEQLLHVALKMAQETMDQQAITYVYDLMANVAFEDSQFNKAEKLFKSTLQRMMSSGYLTTDNSVIEISLKLAVIYSKTRRPNMAQVGFRFCLDTLQSKITRTEQDDDTQLLYGMCADWYAQHLMGCKMYPEAESLLQRSMQISAFFNGHEHPQTLNLINSLGACAALLQDFDKSLLYLKYTIRLSVGTESSAAYYSNLGNVYVHMRLFDEAVKWCRKALRSAKSDDLVSIKNAENCLKDARRERLR